MSHIVDNIVASADSRGASSSSPPGDSNPQEKSPISATPRQCKCGRTFVPPADHPNWRLCKDCDHQRYLKDTRKKDIRKKTKDPPDPSSNTPDHPGPSSNTPDHPGPSSSAKKASRAGDSSTTRPAPSETSQPKKGKRKGKRKVATQTEPPPEPPLDVFDCLHMEVNIGLVLSSAFVAEIPTGKINSLIAILSQKAQKASISRS